MKTWSQTSPDVIIIGSGPGGACAAAELSKMGKKVLILERGSSTPVRGTMLQSIGYALIPGRSLYFTPELLALVRFITLGGSSIGYYATAFEPASEFFGKYGIDLRSEIKLLYDELPIAPIADNLVGPSAKRIMAAATQLGYPWKKLNKIIYQDKCRTECDKCTMGCPYGAKWTSREYIDQAAGHGAMCLAGAMVTGMTTAKNRVTHVHYTYNGSQYQAAAQTVVLSAGGIGTPVLLRRLGIDRAGSDFFFDPLVVVVGTLDDLDGGREFPMVAGFDDTQEGYLLSDLIWPGWVRTIFTLRAGRLDRLTGHRKKISIMVKIKDDLSGRLTDKGWADKRLTQADHMRLKRGVEVAKKILVQTGARNIYQTGVTAVHPGGTAKIGEVVDPDLKTNFENLYACDASVIPEAWGLPPAFTVLALSKRLSKHLAQV